MLVLTRKIGEKIHIGETIVITVVEIDRNRVRIGVDAPRETPIYRQELLDTAPASPRPESAAHTRGG